MKVIETFIKGLVVIEPTVFADKRGYFFESFNEKQFTDLGLNYKFIQDNESKSTYGVIRGLPYQLEPYAQAKLVRVLQGSVFDVAVDIRKGSPTFGKWFGQELNSENKLQLLIPRGFAHGFSVLSDIAIFSYKCTNIYNKQAERSILYNDEMLKIDWKVEMPIVSPKDLLAKKFSEIEKDFIYQTERG